MAFDLNGKFIEESEIFEKAVEEPIPCLLLNPNLSLDALNAIEKVHFIVEVEHEGKMYKAALFGYYRISLEQAELKAKTAKNKALRAIVNK
ncbi:MAG: hypothetical protein OXU23_17315 [Candidatus Poribacteria bacterium]|nr:hypothetical protein [Candidatus Poribacteria bacterium]